ncbi:MAG: DNA polymerase I [Alistipes sp.]
MKKLFLVDAYALIFKYYYAFMGRPMRNRAGMNTSIVFGFTKFLRDIIKREHPDLLGVAFDPKGGSFRKDIFPDYKANRPATPEDIIASVPYIKRIVEAMCIPILEVEGFEADDVIGTLAHLGSAAGYDVYMVTPDKDYGQLVGDHRSIYKQKGDGIEIVDRAAIREKYGIDNPLLVRDILALWGDASDNIPGVPGVGEKGACKLVGKWGTVENIIEHAAEIGGRTGESIAANRERLQLAKTLTTIRLDVPIEFREEDLTVCCPKIDALRALFAELDFKAFAADLTNMAPPEDLSIPRQAGQYQLANMARAKSAAMQKAAMAGQGSLFDAIEPIPTPTTAPQEADIEESTETEAAEEERTTDNAPQNTESIATVPHDYRIVRDAAALRETVAEVAKHDSFCFDLETTGFDMFRDRIVGLSLAVNPHEAWYIPFNLHDSATDAAPRNKIESEYAAILRPLFENESIAKIGQNMKFDILFLRSLGIGVQGRKYDTMLLHYLLDPEARHGMNALAERYLGYSPIEIETLIGRGAKQLTMDMVGLERIAEYAAEDADITLQLYRVLYPLVGQQNQTALYERIEEPLIDVLADMEWTGVRIDSASLARYSASLTERLSALQERIRTMAGDPALNINSSRQLGELLFTKMRIADKPKMTKTKQFCTDEEYLQGFAHQHAIVDTILQYRGVKKLLSTYVDALPLLVNPVTGHIHTSYNQAVTATGRLSSANPNLQNIPVREEIGRPIREAFIPSDERHLLLSADYSQVELRLMAHLSGDESLHEAFMHGEDIHAATAAKIFGKPLGEVTSEERRRAKTANFGIIYGISAFGLSQRLDIPRSEAKALIDGYFASYPKVREYMERVTEQARREGYVTTLFGRRRYLADITSRNANARAFAERNAINAPIQGSAADIMKIAMIEVWRRFRAEGIRSHIILQVHDEIVVDMLVSEREKVERIVREAMEGAAQLSVPLVVDCGVGKNWLEAH